MKGSGRYFLDGVSCRLGAAEYRVVNMSVSGMFVETSEPPADGHALELDVSLPSATALRISGRVAWVNEVDTPRSPALPPGFGFQVERMGFDDRMTIIACLRSAGPGALQRPAEPAPA